MKILHVITSLRTGGAEKLMVDLLPRMQREGHEVDLCVFDGVRTPFYEELEKCGVKVIPLGHSVYSPSHIQKLRRLMRGYDVVHTHNTACQYYVALASLFVSCRCFTTEHNTTNRRRNAAWRMLDRWMYGRYEKIVCISELTQTNLIRHVGKWVANKCVVIFNGIDLEHFATGPNSSIKDATLKLVLMVSAFREQKDQKTLIRAMQWLPPSYVLKLAGGGEKRLIAECKDLATTLGVEGRVEFLGVRTDVPMLLQEVDVVVLSSHYEGLSLSSLEGMASGKPFIASDVEGLRDIVGGYGMLFPHGDDKALADAVRQMCEDENARNSVVRKCLERVRMFDINVMTTKYLDLYCNN